jgi:hypothetical protein
MKVIFLDVDGVLNSEESRKDYNHDESWMWNEVAFSHLKLLKEIVDKTGAEIILSSSWRLYHPLHTGEKRITDPLMNVLIDKMSSLNLSIKDVTPDLCGSWRGREIEKWLNDHPQVEKYVILDDDKDFLPEQKPYFINTTFKYGLTEELTKKAIEILT